MRITSKGQVTIPQAIHHAAALLPHTEVEFVFENEQVILRAGHHDRPSRLQRAAVPLTQAFRGKSADENGLPERPEA
jgi:bifunctional DNA-binding transcriptional regulator/antitoxin component of YhaV-PrlF toxin-antitoxin module